MFTDKASACRLLKNPLEPERIQEIITEAVEIEKSFICDSLPVSTAMQAQVLLFSVSNKINCAGCGVLSWFWPH